MTKLPIAAATATHVTMAGRRVLTFGGCNYLGLAHHPEVHAALARGLSQYGLSTSASRETTGNTLAHDRLEQELLEVFATPDAVVVPDGYTANLVAAQALAERAGPHGVALIDQRSHRSIREAIAGAGLELMEFAHGDAAHAVRLMRELSRRGRAIVAFTDGVFAADGSLAPLPELLAALPEAGATLVVDDCHGFCTLGPRGFGSWTHFGLPMDPRVVFTTTLAKGLGCHGGVVAGSRPLCADIRARASAYVCTTPVSPAIAVAATRALEIVRAEPERVRRLQRSAARLRELVRALGAAVADSPAPVTAFVLEPAASMPALHRELLDAGILAPLITYPGGPAPAYFRLSVTSEHGEAELEQLGQALQRQRALSPCAA